MNIELGLVWWCLGVAIGAVSVWGVAHIRFRRSKVEMNHDLALERANFNAQVATKEAQLQGARAQIDLQTRDLVKLREEGLVLTARVSELQTRLEEAGKAYQEQKRLIEDARTQLSDTFKAMSAEALRTNNHAFLDLAKITMDKVHQKAQGDLERRKEAIESVLKPVQVSLDSVGQTIQNLEKARSEAYGALDQHLRSLFEAQRALRSETSHLAQALKSPVVGGRWGEIQLKRVVEMAGMLAYCDFFEQASVGNSDERLRPDMVIRLPGQKTIVVDAKAPLSSYLEAQNTTDREEKISRLKVHAQAIRVHVSSLGKKAYWEQFQPSPDFVILFLPGESIFSSALEQDPTLIEVGAKQRVILATPTTLLATLRAVAIGWRQEGVAKNAEEISELGRELYKRVCDFSDHLGRVGKSLSQSVQAYNSAVGSLEARVLVSARRFFDLQIAPGSKGVASPPQIERVARDLKPEAALAEESRSTPDRTT